MTISKTCIFTKSISSDSVRGDLNELFDSLDGAKFDIDDVTNKCTNVLSNVSEKVMPVKKGTSSIKKDETRNTRQSKDKNGSTKIVTFLENN
jgi:hypothetical protein